MEVPGKKEVFEMTQFHIHVSSEHTLGGQYFGAELHVVHKAKQDALMEEEFHDPSYAVLGFFIEPSATESHPVFDRLLKELDHVADEAAHSCNVPALPHWWQAQQDMVRATDYSNQTVNVYSLIPEEAAIFYNYEGGLTTPPCTEAVVWNLVDKPIEITPAQYIDLVGLIINHVYDETCGYSTLADPQSGSTSRPPQDLNHRRVHRICPVSMEDGKHHHSQQSTTSEGIMAEDDPEDLSVSKSAATMEGTSGANDNMIKTASMGMVAAVASFLMV